MYIGHTGNEGVDGASRIGPNLCGAPSDVLPIEHGGYGVGNAGSILHIDMKKNERERRGLGVVGQHGAKASPLDFHGKAAGRLEAIGGCRIERTPREVCGLSIGRPNLGGVVCNRKWSGIRCRLHQLGSIGSTEMRSDEAATIMGR